MSRYLNASDRFHTALTAPEIFGRMPADQLVISPEDKAVLRALAQKKHEYANSETVIANRKMWCATNDMAMTKPPVFIDEICWSEFSKEPELQIETKHPFAQELEDFLRKELYCFEKGFGNPVLEDYIESPLVVHDSGFQIDEDVDTKSSDRNAEVVSRHFNTFINCLDDVEKIKTPEVAVDWERTAQYTELMEEIFEGVIAVHQVGARGLWFTPWDYLIRVMGIEKTMVNMYTNPEFVDAAVKRYVECAMVRMAKYKELGIWASNNNSCRVGSGGYGITSELAAPTEGWTNCDTMQMWGCGNAQIFSGVSPSMHWDFSLKYEIEWMQNFGFNYYGCCEPLHFKMDIMDKIPNLRKISMSPWNKWDEAAPRCKDKYVMSCKPNPAIFSTGDMDEALARAEVEKIINQTQGCSIEVVMKDISTVDYQPQKLIRWCEIARETIDGMFGK